MKNLTKRQEEILNLIKAHILDLGFPPTRADIARSLGFKSPNAAEQHSRAIEKKGFIKILSGASRGIVLNDNESDQIPVIGLVAAGGPILAEENVEKTIPRSNNLISNDIDYYLRVKGDSMVDIGIFEEDLIGVSRSANTKVGSVVVARINNEVTVKTLIEMSQNKLGDIIEAGIYYGSGLMGWANIIASLEPYNYQCKIIGFDTFTGSTGVTKFDNNKSIDLKSNKDAYASAANYLNQIGWKSNQPCFLKVDLSDEIPKKYLNISAKSCNKKKTSCICAISCTTAKKRIPIMYR